MKNGLLSLVFMCVFTPSLAHSLPMVYNFTGTIDYADGYFVTPGAERSFSVGDEFHASLYYYYDSTVTGSMGDPSDFDKPHSQIFMNFGDDIFWSEGFLIKSSGSLDVKGNGGVRNFTNKSYDDWYFRVVVPFFETPINVMPTPAELSRATSASFGTDYIQGQWGSGEYAHVSIHATLAPFGSSEPVPEPATVLLLASGLAGLAAVSRRKRK